MRIFIALLLFIFMLSGTLSVFASCVTGYACSLKDLNAQKEIQNKKFPYPKISKSSNLTKWNKSKQDNGETNENINHIFTYKRLINNIKVVQIGY